LKPKSRVDGLDGSIGGRVVEGHVSYGPLVQALLKKFNGPSSKGKVVKGLAHITAAGSWTIFRECCQRIATSYP